MGLKETGLASDGTGFLVPKTADTLEGPLMLNAGPQRANFKRQLTSLPPFLTDVAKSIYAEIASSSCSGLPSGTDWNPSIVLFNWYVGDEGLPWHADTLERDGMQRAPEGSPVLSLSLGDSCDFCWRPASLNYEEG